MKRLNNSPSTLSFPTLPSHLLGATIRRVFSRQDRRGIERTFSQHESRNRLRWIGEGLQRSSWSQSQREPWKRLRCVPIPGRPYQGGDHGAEGKREAGHSLAEYIPRGYVTSHMFRCSLGSLSWRLPGTTLQTILPLRICLVFNGEFGPSELNLARRAMTFYSTESRQLQNVK